jgi:hypothetical protein
MSGKNCYEKEKVLLITQQHCKYIQNWYTKKTIFSNILFLFQT